MEYDVTVAVKGRWPGILKTLGVPDKYLSNRNQPCPFCKGNDRYTFTDLNGDGVYLCRGCGNGNGWKFVQNYFKVDFKDAVEMVEPLVGIIGVEQVEVQPKKDPVPALRFVASKRKPVEFSGEVGRYLQSRGFDSIPEGLKEAELDYYEEGKSKGKYKTLCSLVQDFEGNGVSFHITYIQNGQKADVANQRKIMTPKGTITGAAVRLDVDFTDSICVAEGIETAYAAGKDCGLPAFATLTAHGLEAFIPPEQVKTVWIYGDSDFSFTGQSAAYALAKRLKLKGLTVAVVLPDRLGEDFNDALLK